MTEQAEATLKIEVPSSQDSQPEATPGAETVVAAAIQTGAAAERTEQAAEKAEKTLTEAEQMLVEIRASIRSELAPLEERLATLEAENAEEITADEEDDTPAIVSAEIVELEEPQKPKEETLTRQEEQPQEKRGSGGFLKRLFLNR